jgi:hypothetical protein
MDAASSLRCIYELPKHTSYISESKHLFSIINNIQHITHPVGRQAASVVTI